MKRVAGMVCILFLVLCCTWVGAADATVTGMKDDIGSAGDASAFSRGPYLTGTTVNETVVNWMGTIPVVGTVAYASDASYQETGGYEQQFRDDAEVALHHVSITGLQPDTCYHYAVTVGGETSGDHTFRTFPESGPFTFIVYGDTQEQLPYFTQTERHALVAERIATEEPDALFVLHVGDTVCEVEDVEEWDRFFAAGSALFANTTIVAVLGNHENNATVWYEAFGMPEWYSFDCGDAHFVVLDSNDWAAPHLDEETAWLRADLEESPAGRTFVAFHHPPYSSGTRHPGGWSDLRELWGPVLEEYGVDMVFTGHVHSYQRYAVNGIHYVIAATGGGMMYNLTEDKAEGYAASADHQLGYVRVTVDDDRVTSVFVPVAVVSADNRAVTEVFPVGTEYDPVVVGGCDDGIVGVFEEIFGRLAPLF
ncbi:metallophosphoesterase family protein [Methanogenium sp. MK-MG]|uniref:purple acid phosphatase family protein n=1 Tax=Methanogenium sp. MK-MG TaxID=2599926 RepID=UPI0013EAFB90|nr:metallophosphoesterase family protein [Methanogenium sp. MK-MG]KAF1078752.1 3',5'-cyclic adenosine monophosphate phosphodiesterase CpdA [Methanogenium sp. MK-MG]